MTAILLTMIGLSHSNAAEIEVIKEVETEVTEPLKERIVHPPEKKKIPFLWSERPMKDH